MKDCSCVIKQRRTIKILLKVISYYVILSNGPFIISVLFRTPQLCGLLSETWLHGARPRSNL